MSDFLLRVHRSESSLQADSGKSRFRYVHLKGIRPSIGLLLLGVARHDHMVALVEQMLQLPKQQAAASDADRELYQRQIARPAVSGVDATDREIGKLVYNLYGLTEEEIKIVEENRP